MVELFGVFRLIGRGKLICYDKLWLMMKQIKPIIESNDFSDYESNVTDPEILKVLSDYRIKRENAEKRWAVLNYESGEVNGIGA